MSRLTMADSMMRLLSTPDQAHERLESFCLDVHSICMGLISRSIELEIKRGRTRPEFMSLLLACAQMTQSTATLSRLRSDHLLSVLNACAEVCRACATSCTTSDYYEDTIECRDACLRCAEACQNFIVHVPMA